MRTKVLLCSLAISLGMIACNERTEEHITTKNLQKENFMSESMKKASVSFTFRLGRVSKNCGGFGVCVLSALGVTIVEGPIKITVTKSFEDDVPEFGLKATYKLNSSEELKGLEDNTFYVDQDFYSSDEDGVKYIFHKGEYSFDPTIGEFGGYALNVTTL